jgi:hypothetical protein
VVALVHLVGEAELVALQALRALSTAAGFRLSGARQRLDVEGVDEAVPSGAEPGGPVTFSPSSNPMAAT